MTPIDLDQLVEEIITLPSLPQNIDHITSLLNEPEPSMPDLGRAIASDPAFALKTLRLVNSAYYGLRQQVSSVELAVNLLGLKVIRNLVITAMVCDTMQGAELLLRHSVACGFSMRAIARHMGHTSPLDEDESFAFGLLHDIGKIVFETFLPDETAQVYAMAHEKKIPLYEAERIVLGADHAEMGSRLVLRWRLPARLAACIASHHSAASPEDPVVGQISGLIAVADTVSVYSGFPAHPTARPNLLEREWIASNLTKNELPAIVEGFVQSLPALEELMVLTG